MAVPTTTNEYDLGSQMSVKVTITNESNAVSDPSVVTCTVTDPFGVSTVYTYGTSSNLTKTSTGLYKCVLIPTVHGLWYYRWASSGGVTQQEEFKFYVKALQSA